MNERDIQITLWWHRTLIQPFPTMIPNVYLWEWESDLLYLTKNNYVYEYEIKISHSDFLADAKKSKHIFLSSGQVPRKFFYVCPENLIQSPEIPDYAGLIYISSEIADGYKFHRSTVVQEAPTHKTRKLSEGQIQILLKKGVTRYWHYLTRDTQRKRKNV